MLKEIYEVYMRGDAFEENFSGCTLQKYLNSFAPTLSENSFEADKSMTKVPPTAMIWP